MSLFKGIQSKRKKWLLPSLLSLVMLILSSCVPSFFGEHSKNLQVSGIISAEKMDHGNIVPLLHPGDFYRFLEKNRSNFSEHFYETMGILSKISGRIIGPTSPKFIPKIPCEWHGGVNFCTASDFTRTQRVIFWFPPYHYPSPIPTGFAGGFIKDPNWDPSWTLIVIDSHDVQYSVKNFEEYYTKLNEATLEYIGSKKIGKFDILITSMGAQAGIRFANDHVNEVQNIYLHEIPLAKKDKNINGFLNGGTGAITSIEPLSNGLVPNEILNYFVSYSEEFQKDPNTLPSVMARRILSSAQFSYSEDLVFNYSLFSEQWQMYQDRSVEKLPHFEDLKEKVRCLIAYKNDKIAPIQDFNSMANSGTKVIEHDGGHTKFSDSAKGQSEFAKDFIECVGENFKR